MDIKGNKTQPPVVLVDFYNDSKINSIELLRKEVEGYGWRLYNLSATKGFVPHSLKIIGGLTQHSIDDPVFKMFEQKKVPYVRVGALPKFYYRTTKKPTVAIDISRCGEVAAEFFAERGFNHIAYIGSKPMGDGNDLYLTYKKTAESMGCKLHFKQIPLSDDIKAPNKEAFLWESAKDVTNWLASLPKPVGLLAYSDRFAARYIAYCLEAGLRVPEDIAVLGIGNASILCESAAIPISSIDLPWAEMWIESLKLLKSIHEGVIKEPEPYYINPSYISERASTEVVAIEDPLVKKGVQFIWENYSKNIGVDDLVNSLGVSRRTLQRIFQDSLGRGVNEEIRKKRIEVSKRLLLNTSISVTEISQKCGYSSRKYFCTVFAKALNCTPIEYRKENETKVNMQ
jgi:LacI family transcriptional regulator